MDGIENSEYYLSHIFDSIDPKIKLDEEQKAVVLGNDDYALVIAGAGTGKTTTIAAKVKYLVDIRNIPPEKILIMSYTRKSVEDLRRRINVDFDIPAIVTTFHSLGLKYLRLSNEGKKVCPVSENERYNYFLSYLKEIVFPSKEKMESLVSVFNDDTITWIDSRIKTYGSFFMENYKNFDNFDDYFEAYLEKKIRETENIVEKVNNIADQKVNGECPITIRGERVKSKGEAIIANYLFCNNIDYEYEELYDELVGDRQTYRPDFSIDIGGEKIYIEFFGMSGNNKIDNNSYEKIRKIKENYHRQKHNKFIGLDYLPNRGYLKVLEEKLENLGVKLMPKPIEEIYKIELKQNPLAEFFNLAKLFYKIIDTIKSSEKISASFEEYKKICSDYIDNDGFDITKKHQLEWIEDFWNYYYTNKNHDSQIIRADYADMIKSPQGTINTIIPDKIDFDYIIVDEYQDISAERFKLLKETLDKSGAKFIAIGDDWQSIYSFQGAKINYIIDFDKYFPNAKHYLINKTYRNAQSLIDAAGEFVMRNSSQIKKDLKSNKDIYKPICFAKIKERHFLKNDGITDQNAFLEFMIKRIHKEYPKDNICVIGRTNSSIDSLFRNSSFIDSAENKVRIKGVDNFYFDAMTIHKSKGLTYDWTIVMPLTKNFPSEPKQEFWAIDIIKNNPEKEFIQYAEQRRLLYVALTRTKNRVYLLVRDKNDCSKYESELSGIIKKIKEQQEEYIYK